MIRKSTLGVLLLGLMISGCGGNASDSPVTPAPDRPTFLYFYTDG